MMTCILLAKHYDKLEQKILAGVLSFLNQTLLLPSLIYQHTLSGSYGKLSQLTDTFILSDDLSLETELLHVVGVRFLALFAG
jgi:hypothetical protein